MSKKVKTDNFVNVIYNLIRLGLKIQLIFTSGLANLIDKLMHEHLFVLILVLQLTREIFPVILNKGVLISI